MDELSTRAIELREAREAGEPTPQANRPKQTEDRDEHAEEKRIDQ